MGFILDELMFIWSKEENGSMVLKDETKKWILNIIKRGWKCRLTFTDGSKVVGIPIEFKNNIELILRSADILDDENKIIGTYSLEKITVVETVENELSNSILKSNDKEIKPQGYMSDIQEQRLKYGLTGNEKVILLDSQAEYGELAKMLGGEVIHITPNNSNPGYFNSLELSESHITDADIINTVENIIKIRKMLNPSNRESKDILEAVCLKNNLKLSDEHKVEILRAIQSKLNN